VYEHDHEYEYVHDWPCTSTITSTCTAAKHDHDARVLLAVRVTAHILGSSNWGIRSPGRRLDPWNTARLEQGRVSQIALALAWSRAPWPG
jgi:hypothetical protein